MVNDGTRKRLPPYVSYRTFQNFIDRLQQRLPSRIDRSYWEGVLSGSTGIQLVAGLRFLGLIDSEGRPTERLKRLLAASGEQRNEVFRQITMDAYGFALRGSLDIQNATYAQLDEVLHDTFQVTGDVSRKCIKFFVSLAGDSGITLSPFMTKRFRKTHNGTGTSGTKNITKRVGRKVLRNLEVPNSVEIVPEDSSWNSMLLAKFPSFDPSWNDEVKLKWFTAFDELMRRGSYRPGPGGAGSRP